MPALMQDVHTLRRCLVATGTGHDVNSLDVRFHRRLVRRWECDTDLPKPGPFPQISHTAAMVQTPQVCWVPATPVGRPLHFMEPDSPE